MRIVFEAGQNFRAFLSARLIFVTVLLGVGALFRPPEGSLLPYLALFAANSAVSVGGWELYRNLRTPVVLRWLTLTLAVGLDTLVLEHIGRGDTVFVFLYFFSVAAAGLLTGWAGSAWTTLLCTLGLSWLVYSNIGDFGAEGTSGILLYALNFALTAILSSYLHATVRRRERVHRETLGELRQTRLDTQAILDSLSTGVVVIDQDRHVLFSNPSGRHLTGADSGDDNASLERCLSPDSPIGGALTLNLHDADCGSTKEAAVTLDGRRRIIGCSVAPMMKVDGEVRGHVLLLTDLTPMKEAEWAERERERLAAIGMLSRDLAHEIRNPLATVRGCVEMIESVQDKVEQKRFLDLAMRESDRLNDFLRDFLAFAKSESPNKEVSNFTEFLRNRLPSDLPGVKYVDHLPDRLDISMDPEQLGLVVDAVIFSLAEWAEGQAEICLDADSNGKKSVRFLLPGITVPAEYKNAVFQPFSNVNRMRHGLALPTALRAVHAHGGKLTLETESGIGTWFDLKL